MLGIIAKMIFCLGMFMCAPLTALAAATIASRYSRRKAEESLGSRKPVWVSIRRDMPGIGVAVACFAAGVFLLLSHRIDIQKFPFDIATTDYRGFWSYAFLGNNDALIGYPLRYVLLALIFALCAFASYGTYNSLQKWRPTVRKKSIPVILAESAVILPPPLALLVGFISIYCLLIVFSSAFITSMSDRYMIPPLTLGGLVALLAAARRTKRVPLAAWSLVLVMYCFSIVVGHDYFAKARARVDALSYAATKGIPRSQIAAGFDTDMEYQIQTQGYINDGRLTRPPDAYQRKPNVIELHNPSLSYDVGSTPAIQPEYILLYERAPELPVVVAWKYHVWLRRVDQYVYVQRLNRKVPKPAPK